MRHDEPDLSIDAIADELQSLYTTVVVDVRAADVPDKYPALWYLANRAFGPECANDPIDALETLVREGIDGLSIDFGTISAQEAVLRIFNFDGAGEFAEVKQRSVDYLMGAKGDTQKKYDYIREELLTRAGLSSKAGRDRLKLVRRLMAENLIGLYLAPSIESSNMKTGSTPSETSERITGALDEHDRVTSTNSQSFDDSSTKAAPQARWSPSPPSPAADAHVERSKTPCRTRWVRPPRWAIIGLVVVVVAVVGFVSTRISGSNAATPSPPSAVSSTGKPVVVGDVSYERDGDATTGAWSYAFPRKLSPADVAKFPGIVGNAQAYQDWALGMGGVNPDDASLQITVHGDGSQTIVIRDVQVIKQCRRPLTGTLLYLPPNGVPGDIGISFDLDQPFPVAEDSSTQTSFFGGPDAHTITLRPGEPATLLIDAVTARQYCQFSFKLIIDTGDGHKVSEIVNNHGKPFEVTAIAPTARNDSVSFSDYQAVYTYSPHDENTLVAVNPATFNG